MKTLFVKYANLFRFLSFLYLIGICLFWILDNGIVSGFINWPILIISTILIVQLFAKLPWADGIVGFILTLLSFYMLLAVTSDFVDHFNGTKPVSTFWVYFGMGYGIFTLTTVAALTIMYSAFRQDTPFRVGTNLESELNTN